MPVVTPVKEGGLHVQREVREGQIQQHQLFSPASRDSTSPSDSAWPTGTSPNVVERQQEAESYVAVDPSESNNAADYSVESARRSSSSGDGRTTVRQYSGSMQSEPSQAHVSVQPNSDNNDQITRRSSRAVKPIERLKVGNPNQWHFNRARR